MACIFCDIASGKLSSLVVFQDENSLAFLDNRPLFPGHVLLIPKEHFETLADLPAEMLGPFFKNAQLVARAVESALDAHGSFVAINNRVSQSVPHLHVHVVPRRKKDGLKGFFWPRTPYKSDEEAAAVQEKLKGAIEALKNRTG